MPLALWYRITWRSDGDAEPVEVGSGTHRWSYQVPGADRPVLSLDSTLVDLIDDAEAWATALRSVPELARFEVGLQGHGDMTVGYAVSLLPNADAARATLEAALAALGCRHVSGG